MNIRRGFSAFLLIGISLCLQAALAAQGRREKLPDYSSGPGWFPNVLSPYRQHTLPPVVLENSPRLHDLIHDGKLEISLSDALSLAIENNLDIFVQRYVVPMAQTDVLRTKAGSAARGFSGANIPLGLSAGALGLGVSTTVAGGGVGGTGGITGGGGAVVIPPVGTFDPTINYNFSWDRTTAPLNTTVVAGVPFVTSYSASYAGSYTQMMPSGTSYFVSLNGLRGSSTQLGLLFDPSVATRMSMGFNQPLLSGLGFKPNKRFLLVARNNQNVVGAIFRQNLDSVIVQVENAYWDMAAFQENVKLAEQSLAASQQQLVNNQEMAKIGVLAELDVVSSEATVAAAQRDLVLARTNLQFQQNQFKTILSKRMDPEVEAAEIVTTDSLPEPRDADIPDLQTTLTEAYNRRSSLRIAQVNLLNEQISTQYTANNLLPVGNIFAQYAGAGLKGNTAAVSGKSASQTGVSDSLTQMIQGAFPEYSGGFSLTLPIRNRTAQADNLRAQLEAQQAEVSVQQIRNEVSLEVRQAMTGVVQGKAQVQAAHQAARLAQQTLETEQGKLTAGVSTPYNVILRQRDFVAAQEAEVQAMANYAKSLVALDNARGGLAERNGILIQDALSGTITQTPVSPFKNQDRTPGAR